MTSLLISRIKIIKYSEKNGTGIWNWITHPNQQLKWGPCSSVLQRYWLKAYEDSNPHKTSTSRLLVESTESASEAIDMQRYSVNKISKVISYVI